MTARLSEEFKEAVQAEAERQGKKATANNCRLLLDMLTDNVCQEYINNVQSEVDRKIGEYESTERELDRKIKELDEKIEQANAALKKYEIVRDETTALTGCAPKSMVAIVNMFSAMTDSAIERGADPDVAVSKVAYMMNAYLGGDSLPDDDECDGIGEYKGPANSKNKRPIIHWVD